MKLRVLFGRGRWVSLMVLLCAGCAAAWTSYVPPPLGTPTADLLFRLDPNYRGGSQHLFTIDSETCDGPRYSVAVQGGLGNGDAVRIATDQRIVLLARSVNGGPLYGHEAYCANVGSFVPEVGHFYEVIQTTVPGSCELRVKDRASGKSPASYVVHPVPRSCLF